MAEIYRVLKKGLDKMNIQLDVMGDHFDKVDHYFDISLIIDGPHHYHPACGH